MGKLKVLNSYIANAYKTKSFTFYFIGVFLFGSLLIGFLGSAYLSILQYLNTPKIITYPAGPLSSWGYISLFYLIFSTIYVYKKAGSLNNSQSKAVGLLLGLYICSCVFCFYISGYFSFLFLLGSIFHSLAFGIDIYPIISVIISF